MATISQVQEVLRDEYSNDADFQLPRKKQGNNVQLDKLGVLVSVEPEHAHPSHIPPYPQPDPVGVPVGPLSFLSDKRAQ